MAPRVRVEGWEVPGRLPCGAPPARVPDHPVVMEEVLAEELDEEEQLVRRHRREKKELQGDGAGAGTLKVACTRGWERGVCPREPGGAASLDPRCSSPQKLLVCLLQRSPTPSALDLQSSGVSPCAACSRPPAGAGRPRSWTSSASLPIPAQFLTLDLSGVV